MRRRKSTYPPRDNKVKISFTQYRETDNGVVGSKLKLKFTKVKDLKYNSNFVEITYAKDGEEQFEVFVEDNCAFHWIKIKGNGFYFSSCRLCHKLEEIKNGISNLSKYDLDSQICKECKNRRG